MAENSAVWRVAGGAEDLLEVVGEAHVEHLVGLVEHDGLDLVEPERAAVEVVDARGPGVATTTSTPRASAVELAVIGWPP